MSSMLAFFEHKYCTPAIMIQIDAHHQAPPPPSHTTPNDCALADAQVVPGIPDHVQELLNIKVAHFEPVAVSLVGRGVYPALALTLPRARNGEYDQALIEAQDSLRAAQLRPQPVPR